MTDQPLHEIEPTTGDLQEYITALEEIDTKIHELLEDLSDAEEMDATRQADAIQTLREIRSQIDPALLAFRQQDTPSTPESESITLQWNPTDTPPRRLIVEPATASEEWTSRELEWDGSGWRRCSRDSIDDVAISAPAERDLPNPTDPPTLDTLLDRLRGNWDQPDPPALVFDATTTTEQGVVVAVDDELRYRERDDDQWYAVTEDGLQHHLQQQGQPRLTTLSETPLEREHFTASPLADLGSDSGSNSP